jgi:DNA-binding GntR family transcriptional regulator
VTSTTLPPDRSKQRRQTTSTTGCPPSRSSAVDRRLVTSRPVGGKQPGELGEAAQGGHANQFRQPAQAEVGGPALVRGPGVSVDLGESFGRGRAYRARGEPLRLARLVADLGDAGAPMNDLLGFAQRSRPGELRSGRPWRDLQVAHQVKLRGGVVEPHLVTSVSDLNHASTPASGSREQSGRLRRMPAEDTPDRRRVGGVKGGQPARAERGQPTQHNAPGQLAVQAGSGDHQVNGQVGECAGGERQLVGERTAQSWIPAVGQHVATDVHDNDPLDAEVLGGGPNLPAHTDRAVDGIKQDERSLQLRGEPRQRRVSWLDRHGPGQNLPYVERQLAQADELHGRPRTWQRVEQQPIPGVAHQYRRLGELQCSSQYRAGDRVATATSRKDEGAHSVDHNHTGSLTLPAWHRTVAMVRRAMSERERVLPKYLRIAGHIRDQIARGDLTPGDEVPSERELAASWHVARPTAARALESLRTQGLVESRQGSGTYVRAAAIAPRARERYARAHELGTMYGPSETVELLATELTAGPTHVLKALQLPTGANAAKRVRLLRRHDGRPSELSTSWFSTELTTLAPKLLEPTRLHGGTAHYIAQITNRPAAYARDQVAARMANTEELDLLQLTPPAAVLVYQLTVFDADDQPIQFDEATYPPQHWSFHQEYPLTDSRVPG